MLHLFPHTSLAQMCILVRNKSHHRKNANVLYDKAKNTSCHIGETKMNDLLFQHKEMQQENYILSDIADALSAKLTDAEIEKTTLEFEFNNAHLLKQHLLGIFSFYSDIIRKLNQAMKEDKINREFAQEEDALFDIVKLLTKNVAYLEKINQQLEQRIHEKKLE